MPLSNAQQKYLAIAWACFETEPKIDYEKFRTLAGLASAHSARELMRVTKKKLREEYGMEDSTPAKKTGGSTPTSNAKTSTGGRKRKTAAKDADDDDDATSGTATPTAARSRKTAAKKVKTEVTEDEVDQGGNVDMEDGEEYAF